jgi:hypothetical protein
MSPELIGVVGFVVFFGDDSPWNDNSVGGRTSDTFRVA